MIQALLPSILPVVTVPPNVEKPETFNVVLVVPVP